MPLYAHHGFYVGENAYDTGFSKVQNRKTQSQIVLGCSIIEQETSFYLMKSEISCLKRASSRMVSRSGSCIIQFT